MPNQITHIALAAKVFADTFTKFDKSEFFIGTAFPDIRYLSMIDRDRTHFDNISLESVLNAKTSFAAGLLFHNLIDGIFVKEVINFLPGIKGLSDIDSGAKLLADELFYSKVNDWPQIIKYFDNILPEELDFGMDEKYIWRWHKALWEIFKERPTDDNRSEFMIELNFSEENIKYYNELLFKIRGNKEIAKILLDFYNGFSL